MNFRDETSFAAVGIPKGLVLKCWDAFVAVAFIAATALPVHATVLYDNLAGSRDNGISLVNHIGASFSTSGSVENLTSVELVLQSLSFNGTNGGDVTVDLRQDGSAVSLTLGTISVPDFSHQEFGLFGLSEQLAANSRYWIELTGPTSIFWDVDLSPPFPANVSGEFLHYTGPVFANSDLGRAHLMRITANAPEPSSVALLGLGLAGFAFGRRKKS